MNIPHKDPVLIQVDESIKEITKKKKDKKQTETKSKKKQLQKQNKPEQDHFS